MLVHVVYGNRFVRRLCFGLSSIARALSAKVPLQAVGHQQIESLYAINLERQPTRWQHLQRELSRYTLSDGRSLRELCHRVPAIDARSLDVATADGLVQPTYPLNAQYYVDPDPRLLHLIREKEIDVALSREEMAVALSHIAAWRRVVADKRSYALVLEDDVYFERHFSTQLNQTWVELLKVNSESPHPELDVLYLSFREVDRRADRIECSPNVMRLKRGYWWLSGYVLSQSGARKLLDSLPITGPVDLWMNQQCEKLNILSTPRSIIAQRTDLHSDNRYSILPLLTQIGVQTDKTHLILEETKGRRPVFCVGFSDEGASRLESALSLLGYRCWNNRWGRHSRGVRRVLDSNRPLLFDVYIGIEKVCSNIREVLESYPDSVIILAERTEETKCDTTVSIHLQCSMQEDHGGRVLRTSSDFSWNALCAFLHCEIPPYPMPSALITDNQIALSSDGIRQFPLTPHRTVVQQHDVHPWIVPYERMEAFGILHSPRTAGTQVGRHQAVAERNATCFRNSFWIPVSDTFPSNLAYFHPDNVVSIPPDGCRLSLEPVRVKDRNYSAASICSSESFQYGRFEVDIKPAYSPGVVTAFFLHRNDPWQEIDLEFLGYDTRKLLLNVYYNPGTPGTRCNFGNRGTPVLIDLRFDAAADFHRYAIEWDPLEIRFFVDEHLVHVRAAWEPTPIPDLPMQLFCSIWPPRSSELAGSINTNDLPAYSYVKRFKRWKWSAASQLNSQSATSADRIAI